MKRHDTDPPCTTPMFRGRAAVYDWPPRDKGQLKVLFGQPNLPMIILSSAVARNSIALCTVISFRTRRVAQVAP